MLLSLFLAKWIMRREISQVNSSEDGAVDQQRGFLEKRNRESRLNLFLSV